MVKPIEPAPDHWVDRNAPRQRVRVPPGPRVAELRAVAETLFASQDGPPPAERVDWLLLEVLDTLDRLSTRTRVTLELALTAVTWIAPLTIRRPLPLAALSLEQRVRALNRFEKTPVGLALFALKAVMCILWAEHPEVAREMGFDGQCLDVLGEISNASAPALDADPGVAPPRIGAASPSSSLLGLGADGSARPRRQSRRGHLVDSDDGGAA